jgi:hypothetical protein
MQPPKIYSLINCNCKTFKIIMEEKLWESFNKEMISYNKHLQWEILWELIIKYKWKLMNNYFQNFQMNQGLNMLINLYTQTILYIEDKWKKLMNLLDKKCFKIVKILQVTMEKVLCRIDYLQNMMSKWDQEAKVIVMRKKDLENLKIQLLIL